MNNRIGSSCWYRSFNPATKTLSNWKTGKLRAWSTDHEEYESGPGLIPVGVVEDDRTGLCHSVFVERICFAAAPPA